MDSRVKLGRTGVERISGIPRARPALSRVSLAASKRGNAARTEFGGKRGRYSVGDERVTPALQRSHPDRAAVQFLEVGEFGRTQQGNAILHQFPQVSLSYPGRVFSRVSDRPGKSKRRNT